MSSWRSCNNIYQQQWHWRPPLTQIFQILCRFTPPLCRKIPWKSCLNVLFPLHTCLCSPEVTHLSKFNATLLYKNLPRSPVAPPTWLNTVVSPQPSPPCPFAKADTVINPLGPWKSLFTWPLGHHFLSRTPSQAPMLVSPHLPKLYTLKCPRAQLWDIFPSKKERRHFFPSKQERRDFRSQGFKSH